MSAGQLGTKVAGAMASVQLREYCMIRGQRSVVFVVSCLVAVSLFLGRGPFSDETAWNPLASGGTLIGGPNLGSYWVFPWWVQNPLVGIALPLAFVGLGIFVWLGKPKDEANKQ